MAFASAQAGCTRKPALRMSCELEGPAPASSATRARSSSGAPSPSRRSTPSAVQAAVPAAAGLASNAVKASAATWVRMANGGYARRASEVQPVARHPGSTRTERQPLMATGLRGSPGVEMHFGFDAKRAFQNATGLGNYGRDALRILAQHRPGHRYAAYGP